MMESEPLALADAPVLPLAPLVPELLLLMPEPELCVPVLLDPLVPAAEPLMLLPEWVPVFELPIVPLVPELLPVPEDDP